ncbi:MAG: GNAT family N-acetyltransferase [Streptosporangiaceae bacterium]
MEIRVEPMTLADLADVLADHARFWGERDLRHLHLTALVQEFGETCLTARRAAAAADTDGGGSGSGGEIDGYLIGFITPRRVGYIHAVAVRDTARLGGVAETLYRSFARAAMAQGAVTAKAITSVANTGSVAFHRRLGFTPRRAEDYDGRGTPMIVLTRQLPFDC